MQRPARVINLLCAAIALGGIFCAGPALAVRFQLPLDCHYGKDCFIQNYVDEAGAGHGDYHCGKLTYPGHNGTDIRLTDFAAMQRGVNVLAAADGTVLRLRDAEPDTGLEAGRETMAHKECGNGVVIQHADGYVTQYCHMQRGSIRVHAGQPVKAGEALGHVGYSGMTEFPHVHFQVTHDGNIIDPFNPEKPFTEATCNPQAATLWASPLPYIETATLNAGFATTPPQRDKVDAPIASLTTAPRSAPALIFWAEAMGIQPGDIIDLTLRAPDGTVLAQQKTTADHYQAAFFRFIGKKFHTELAPGAYTGTLTFTRHDQQVTGAGATRTLQIP